MRRRTFGELMPWLLFAFVGTIFLIVGLSIGASFLAGLPQPAHAEGRVVDYDESDGRYRAIVEFMAADGQRITFVDRTSSDSRVYRLEQAVEVVYDPQGPRRTARINSFSTGLWLLPVTFVGLGGLFAVIGWGGLVKALRRRAAPTQVSPASQDQAP
jgi:hypothetical protein